jgi:anaerobic magnesium-protoporphyrin IX monomethyl ester cyclase
MKILLATLHAKYVHNSLALPCLAAACADMAGVETVIREFTVNEQPDDVLRRVVAEEAELAAFSCYIWNIGQTLRLAADLKKVRPATVVVLGGPEVTYGAFELLEQNRAVDCIVRGEGEETFRELAATLQREREGQSRRDAAGRLLQAIAGLVCRDGDDIVATQDRAPLRNLDTLPSPFAQGLADLAKPLVYWETSRGCPFSCAFCMSSLEQGVRSFSPERIRADLRILTEHGVRTVKLVDRTFNYDARRADVIWREILAADRGSCYHFEIAADLLDDENFRLLEKVPSGMFRFEIGVQSGKEETLARVGRSSDLDRLYANVRRLVATTGVTVHLDLVAGLPHEDYAGFLGSLQQVLDLLSLQNPYSSEAANSGRPEKMGCFVQVEPLKVLKGAPMRKIAVEEGYLFSDTAPYRILQTPWLSFEEIHQIEVIARLLDLYVNSGRFSAALAVLSRTAPLAAVFHGLALFWQECDPLAGKSLAGQFEALWSFGETSARADDLEMLREAFCYDYCLAEYPVAGRLPRFFGEGDRSGITWGAGAGPAELARRLGIGKNTRLRTFSRLFARDPKRPAEKGAARSLMFVYLSSPGQRLEVRVMEGEGNLS